ncbi:T9SS type A sorting domain-containing protein [Flavobacterium sp. NRK F10]|uniref:T9SS type A sorting domain-containing protein n=1 Tax=Flavobacterium sp. NRK F10 TaxID=2954931 RepID=UPI0020901F97|nr:T9SS type A sorting domain-containing protein [Flavobacterium sp. NRK F10]MCO6173961.1 T9SS type A sorting domain-containing protein [Flavobacterium sp. NRK F10]
MKKILLFFFTVTLTFGQDFIQISTNDPNAHVLTNSNDPFNPYNNETSDSGLNQILQNHNISSITSNYHPIDNTTSFFAIYSGNDLTSFIVDLENYSSFVTKVSICPEFETFGDILIFDLVDSTIGVQTGTDNNGVVITNDSGLNTIFQNHNVTYLEYYIQFLNSYTLQCTNCNITDLKTDLLNYSSVINTAEYFPLVFLNETSFDKKVPEIYPNPFSDAIYLSGNVDIKMINLYSIKGKLVKNYNDFENLNADINSLESGIYILQIIDSSNDEFRKKIIKL